ncbi:MAG: hypothetical protein ACJ79H_10210 [Myxococcales bacterium]
MLTTVVVLAVGLIADGSVRVEGRGGTTVGGQDPSSAGVSADFTGRTSGPEGALRFGLSPSAALASEGSQLFVRGFGEADWRLRASDRLRLRQALGYGSIDLSPVAPGATVGPVQPPPGSRFVSVQESSTSLELDVLASRRLHLVASAAWLVAGGANDDARRAFPLSRGPHLRGYLEWSAARLDTLRLELQAFDDRYSNDRRASVIGLAAGWRMLLARGTELSLSVGPAVGRARTPDQPAATVAYAVGGAELRAAPSRGLSTSIGASIEPLGDPLSGELVERGSLRAAAIWDRPRVLSLAARLLASIALTSGTGSPTSPQAGDRYLQGELSATVPLDARSSVSAGARAAFLSRPLLDQPTGQWVAFVAYAAQVPLLR